MKTRFGRLTVTAVCIGLMFAAGRAFGGLTAYWSFDDNFISAGSRAGMDGSPIVESGGSVTIATGQGKVGGGALLIDDVGNDANKTYLQIDKPIVDVTWPYDELSDLPVICISGWYKPQDVGGNGSESWLYIWEGSPGFTASVSINSTDAAGPAYQNPRWAYGSKYNFNDTTGPDYNHDDWNHVVTVFNPRTLRAKFYHNGVLRDYRAIPYDIAMGLAKSDYFYLGAGRAGADKKRNFDGYLDEVAVFDHEPTAAVITGLYDGTYTPATAPTDEVTTADPVARPGWTIDKTINFARPGGMVFNPSDGKLYVARRGNTGVGYPGTVDSGIYAIESDGSATPAFDTALIASEHPQGLVFGSNGLVYFSSDFPPSASPNTGIIYRYDPTDFFSPLQQWVTDFVGDGTSDCDPGAMAILPATFNGGAGSQVHAGDALVVDYGEGGFEKIYVWSTSTAEGEWILHDDADAADGAGSPLVEPWGLAVSDSAIYVSDRLSNAIYSVSPVDGSLTQLTTGTSLTAPTGMAVDPTSGDLFVMTDNPDLVGSQLVRIDLDTGAVSTVADMFVDMDAFARVWPRMVPQLLFSSDGQHLYVSDPETDKIYDLIRSALPPVPGDTDNDRDVDEDDAAVLASHWGAGVAQGDVTSGDFNNDGKVNAADASILAANWTGRITAETAGVPEPSTLVALLAMAAALAIRRR